MGIAFVGDSFCSHINKGSWPLIVAETVNAEIVLAGTSGQCFYHSFQDLLGIIDKADYIIFCVTGTGRLANYHRLPIPSGTVKDYCKNWDKQFKIEFAERFELPKWTLQQTMKAAHDYYENLADFSYHIIAQHGMLKMIDELMIKQQKKCIWLPCFDDSMGCSSDPQSITCQYDRFLTKYFNYFIPESGPLGNISLHNISQDELISMHGRGDALTTAVHQQNIHDKRRNHLNEENNKLLANLIIDIIIKDDFTCQPIKMQDTFNLVGEYIDFHIYNNEN